MANLSYRDFSELKSLRARFFPWGKSAQSTTPAA
jgi:hypothetical protein